MNMGIAVVGRQRRAIRLVLAGLAVAALLAIPASASAKCKPGTHKFGSGQARTFCGKASVTVSIGGQKITLKGGGCERTKNNFTLNIGTILLGVDSPKRPNYFGISVGKPPYSTPASKDGTYTGNGAVAFIINHKRYSLQNPTITLKSNRSKGSFSGKVLRGGTATTGTFSCG
jgi:hypothetical protein